MLWWSPVEDQGNIGDAVARGSISSWEWYMSRQYRDEVERHHGPEDNPEDDMMPAFGGELAIPVDAEEVMRRELLDMEVNEQYIPTAEEEAAFRKDMLDPGIFTSETPVSDDDIPY